MMFAGEHVRGRDYLVEEFWRSIDWAWKAIGIDSSVLFGAAMALGPGAYGYHEWRMRRAGSK